MAGKMGGYRLNGDGWFRRPADVNVRRSFVKTERDRAAFAASWCKARLLLKSLH